jgi:hypothetical protein
MSTAEVATLRGDIFSNDKSDVETIKVKEAAIVKLGEAYVKLQDATALRDLLAQLRPFFTLIPKAKTAKIVRGIVDQIAKVPNSTELQVMRLAAPWGARPPAPPPLHSCVRVSAVHLTRREGCRCRGGDQGARSRRMRCNARLAPRPLPGPPTHPPSCRPTAQVEVCKEQVEWAKTEKRTFLRQRLELRLASLYLDTQQYQLALGLLST